MIRAQKLPLNHIADKLAVGSAQHVGDEKRAQCRNKNNHHAACNARQGERKQNAEKSAPMSRAQVHARLQIGFVKTLHCRIERKNHKRQKHITHPQRHRRVGVEQLQRLELAEAAAEELQNAVADLPAPFQREI